jgi:hypothetical protein
MPIFSHQININAGVVVLAGEITDAVNNVLVRKRYSK